MEIHMCACTLTYTRMPQRSNYAYTYEKVKLKSFLLILFMMFISPKAKYNLNKFLKSQLINKKKT